MGVVFFNHPLITVETRFYTYEKILPPLGRLGDGGRNFYRVGGRRYDSVRRS